jgi:hypothetical protein
MSISTQDKAAASATTDPAVGDALPSRRRVLLLVPAAVFAGVASCLGIGLTRTDNELPLPLIGKPVPDFDLPPVPGRLLGLSDEDLRHEVSLVNVFALVVRGVPRRASDLHGAEAHRLRAGARHQPHGSAAGRRGVARRDERPLCPHRRRSKRLFPSSAGPRILAERQGNRPEPATCLGFKRVDGQWAGRMCSGEPTNLWHRGGPNRKAADGSPFGCLALKRTTSTESRHRW